MDTKGAYLKGFPELSHIIRSISAHSFVIAFIDIKLKTDINAKEKNEIDIMIIRGFLYKEPNTN